MMQLAKYDAMLHAIAECNSVDEAVDIIDEATAIQAYARQAKNRDAEEQVIEIRMRAERRLGEMMKKMPKAQAPNQHDESGYFTVGVSDTPRVPTLDSLGVDKNLAKRARSYARMSSNRFEEEMIAAKQGMTITRKPPAQHYGPRDLTYILHLLNEIGEYLVRYNPIELRSLKSNCDRLSIKIADHLNKEGNVTWLSSTK